MRGGAGWILAGVLLSSGCLVQEHPDFVDPDDAGETGDGDAGADLGPDDPVHTIFVSSSVHNGDLGGRAGADEICAERAAAESLDGTWVALLSTTDLDARDALPLEGPVVDMHGRRIADGLDDLWDGELLGDFSINENGDSLLVPQGWTGTLADGSSSGETCEDWTTGAGEPKGSVGNSSEKGSKWVEDGGISCALPVHLFCVSL